MKKNQILWLRIVAIRYLSYMESPRSAWNEKILAVDLGCSAMTERKAEHDKNGRINASCHQVNHRPSRRLSYAATSRAAEHAENTE